MTLREKVADAIYDAIDNVHDIDVTFDHYAQASADAVISVIAESVEPLEWKQSWAWGLDIWTADGFEISYSEDLGWWIKGVDFDAFAPVSLEAAKAAAQADYTRRILSALGLSTPEQEKGE